MTIARCARVVLVDDSVAMLRHVMTVLPRTFEVVATLDSGATLHTTVAMFKPDIVVLDVTLPGLSGIALCSQLTQVAGHPRVVMLTVHEDPDYMHAAFDAGAAAYVVKMRLSTDLVPALQAVLDGGRFVSPHS